MNKTVFVKLIGFCALLWAMVITGCATFDGGATTTAADGGQPVPNVDILRPGDRLRISFSGLPPEQLMIPQDDQIGESGDISLPLVGSIKAAGKSVNQLQSDIRDAYVPRFYRNLNVSVTTERFYFVGGEVKLPGRQQYLGGLTVLKAIQSAQDFTDFADRKHVRLTRSNGKIEIVNCKKALEDSKYDLPVYPGDTITVPRGF